MQINSYQPSPVSTSLNTAKPSVADTPLQSPQPNSGSNADQVTISSQAKQLSAAESSSPEQLPSTPETPPTGEKLENYADFKKAQVQYQVSSDLINIATGNNDDGISASTAAYLSNNEEARENVMQQKAMQQQYSNMQTYQEQSAQAQNNWVV